jgi:hypothetical protein
MSKIFVTFLALLIPAFAHADLRLDILNKRIESLEAENERKYKALEKCEKETKGFKIAGTLTVASAGVGITANIVLHNKLKNMGSGGATGSGSQSDNRSDADKLSEECAGFCDPSSPMFYQESCDECKTGS